MKESIGKYIKQLSEYFSGSQNISLLCHTNPDGDAIGSMIGLYHFLKAEGKNCEMLSPSALPGFLDWISGANEINVFEDDKEKIKSILDNSDLLVMLDFNTISRIGKMENELKEIHIKSVLIDHHPGPDIKADLVISEPSFSSTAELLYNLIYGLKGEDYINPDFVEAVYVGMMTDTGNFSFGSYDGSTMRILGTMLESGLRKDFITDKVYDNFSADRMRLKGFALAERMVALPEYKTAYIHLSLADLEKFNHRVGDTEGFVNMPLSISGIQVSVLFIEKEDHIKLSLRSKGSFSVNEVARKHFNGGGHTNAAGGRYELPLKSCVQYFESLLEDLKPRLDENRI